MTAHLLTMPRLGETMEEGTIVGWLVRPGEPFRRGAPLVEVETDKTVVEYPALGDGVLEEVLADEGARVAVGEPIARVAMERPGEWDGDPTAREEQEKPGREDIGPSPAATPKAPSSDHARRRATPQARRLAREAGLALDMVPGTGRRGRIERRDVEAALGASPARGGRIAFETLGQGEATFLLIHGFAGDRGTWAAVANGLARAGRRVVLPDLPGHGETAAEADALDDLVREMAAFADTLPRPLHLVGHSLGAAVAVGLAERLGKGAASLTLVAPAGAGVEIDAAFVHGMAEATTAAEIAHLLPRLGSRGGELSRDALEAMAAEAARGRLKPLAALLAGPRGQRIDILRPLDALPEALPVRALIATEDRVIPAHHAFNLSSRVAVHFLKTGHMPQWDAPREMLTLLNGVADD